ncbi:MAG: alginate lyase family protein [Pseudomonadota bacterium]
MSARITSMNLYLRTLRYFRFGQLIALFRNRLFPIRKNYPSKPVTVRDQIEFDSPLLRPELGEHAFCPDIGFLNQNIVMPIEQLDWRCPEQTRLWRYNLHYFDYLLWGQLPEARKCKLIDSWIRSNPLWTKDAWDPYPVSLRLVNWVKYGFQLDKPMPEQWLSSLAQQAAFLFDHLEVHIQANHYLKNIKALIFCGVFLQGTRANKLLDRGLALLSDQLKEQFLDDGGHYELSPMYHLIATEDILDLYNLAKCNAHLFDPIVTAQLLEVCIQSLDFVDSILHPDGEIPFFNDSALGIAARPAALFEYASRLMQYQRSVSPKKKLPHSGYFVMSDHRSHMIVDCGPINPDYQPGHTHCDMLSFELSVNGQRVFVNSGVYDYEDSDERRYCRSVQAHNTLSVGGAEQSELWQVFRVARRAHIVQADFEETPSGFVFSGELEGFPTLNEPVRHRRDITYQPSGRFVVKDSVTGQGDFRVESFLHVHPDMRIHQGEKHLDILDSKSQVLTRLHHTTQVECFVCDGFYYPEFGQRLENQCVKFSALQALPFTFEFQIETDPKSGQI